MERHARDHQLTLVFTIDATAPTPAFQQVCDQVVTAVRTGQLLPGSRLPTVRRLAADLSLSPNTVAKAYRQLEAEGLVETRGRNGTVVLEPADRADAQDDAVLAARAFVAAARRRGLDLAETIGLVRQTW
jgi:GntR family transcriptional regulator